MKNTMMKRAMALLLAATLTTTPAAVAYADEVEETIEYSENITEEASEEETEEVVELYSEEEEIELLNDGYDDVAPVTTNVTVNKTSINLGESVEYTVSVTEEGVGIERLILVIAGRYIYGTPNYGHSGDYTVNYTPSTTGEFHVEDVIVKDANGNTSHNGDYYSLAITVNSEEPTEDTEAPVITDTYPTASSIDAPANLTVVVECHDEDLAQIRVDAGYISNGGNSTFDKQVEYNVSTIAADGIYTVEVPFTDNLIDGDFIYTITVTDTNGNSRMGTGESSTRFHVNYTETSYDLEAPVITSITTTDGDIVLPGIGHITVKGTDNTANTTIKGFVEILNRSAEMADAIYVEFETTTNDDGAFEVTVPFEIGNKKIHVVAGKWEVAFTQVKDGMNNTYSLDVSSNTYCEWNFVNEVATVNIDTTLSDTKLIEKITAMADNGTANILATKAIVPQEVFTAIKGTNKTVRIYNDGISWVFNGKSINSSRIKDINIQLEIAEVEDVSEYGFDSTDSAVLLNFAANGMLPGTAKIRVKSDYITSKYNLSSNLYLAFVTDTADGEYTSDEIVEIEQEGVRLDELGFVEFTLTHNSSYVLTTSRYKDNAERAREQLYKDFIPGGIINDMPILICPAPSAKEESKPESTPVVVAKEETTTTVETKKSEPAVVATTASTEATVATAEETTTSTTTTEVTIPEEVVESATTVSTEDTTINTDDTDTVVTYESATIAEDDIVIIPDNEPIQVITDVPASAYAPEYENPVVVEESTDIIVSVTTFVANTFAAISTAVASVSSAIVNFFTSLFNL